MRFTYREQLAEAERELRLRRSVYPRRVHTGRMKEDQAQRWIEVQMAIIDTLRELYDKHERLL